MPPSARCLVRSLLDLLQKYQPLLSPCPPPTQLRYTGGIRSAIFSLFPNTTYATGQYPYAELSSQYLPPGAPEPPFYAAITQTHPSQNVFLINEANISDRGRAYYNALKTGRMAASGITVVVRARGE